MCQNTLQCSFCGIFLEVHIDRTEKKTHSYYDVRNLVKLPISKLIFSVSFGNSTAVVVGGAVAQSVERSTPGEEVPGSIPAVAGRSLLVGSVTG